MRRAFPRRGAALAWKHSESTTVHQEVAPPHASDRGTGQGDVDAPLEACVVQGAVARSARRELQAHLQGAAALGTANPDLVRWEAAFSAWQGGQRPPEPSGEYPAAWRHPGNAIAAGSGLVDFWYLDDGTVVAHPSLAVRFLEAFDRNSAQVGATRNREKTTVSLLCTQAEADLHAADWQLTQLRALADVSVAPDSLVALGAETTSGEMVAKQFREKTKVAGSMLR